MDFDLQTAHKLNFQNIFCITIHVGIFLNLIFFGVLCLKFYSKSILDSINKKRGTISMLLFRCTVRWNRSLMFSVHWKKCEIAVKLAGHFLTCCLWNETGGRINTKICPPLCSRLSMFSAVSVPQRRAGTQVWTGSRPQRHIKLICLNRGKTNWRHKMSSQSRRSPTFTPPAFWLICADFVWYYFGQEK